jgi:hypothetical protein
MPPPAGNLSFVETAMNRIQQDTQAIIGMTQPGDVFNPEIMAAGNSGAKLSMALGPNQIIQDNAVRNAADGLKEAVYLVWRTLIQYGDDHGVKKLAASCSPEGVTEFLDYRRWEDMNQFNRKQIHIELALGMMSPENRIARQQLIQQTQMQFVTTLQGLVAQGIFDPVMLDKIKKPYEDTLYAVGVKDSDTYLPTDKEIEKLIQQAQQQQQQAAEAAKTNPAPDAQKDISTAKLNDAKTQQIMAEIAGEDPKSQLSYMSMAEGKGKDFYN